jgi:hypothetical protein
MRKVVPREAHFPGNHLRAKCPAHTSLTTRRCTFFLLHDISRHELVALADGTGAKNHRR